MVGAVIYVRVSTKEQTENLSLPTQLRACEEYCRRQGYDVLERFYEEGESAKTTDRSQLQKLLTFCRLNKGRVHFVVVFNLTRFARDPPSPCGLRRARQVRSFRAALAAAIAWHFAAFGHGTDRRHVHRQVDGRRARGVCAIRQRLSL
jgi:DNA invertase Pin-like site-specific DNA recombinase